MHVIPFKKGNEADLSFAKFNIKDNKKYSPANNHKFRDNLKFFIKFPHTIYYVMLYKYETSMSMIVPYIVTLHIQILM